MQAAITLGDRTDHGGVVVEADSSFLVDGKPVHLAGMKHYCPKCKKIVRAMSSSSHMIINGKPIIVANDKTDCGATFLPSQNLLVRERGQGSFSAVPTILDTQNTNNNLVDERKSYSVQFEFKDMNTNDLLSDYYYVLTLPDGSKIEGFTDQDGKTEIHNIGYKPDEVKIETYDLSNPLPPLE